MNKFPKNFLWGCATSAPQSEGHSTSSGKSESTWDKWYQLEPEKFYQGQGPEDTTLMYEYYKDDVQRMVDLGINSFRTSISWSRLMPDGHSINQEAVKFYRSYFTELLNADILPIVNLFHFDMPWWLMEEGGWESRQSVDYFQRYARTAFELFGDLVNHWTTFNEPMVHIEMGYLYGHHYPAIVNLKKAVQVGYHTLLAHAKAVEVFRTQKITDGKIGIILNVTPAYARSESAEDTQARELADLIKSDSFLVPCIEGTIPHKLITLLKANELMPNVETSDGKMIQDNTVDFIGLNYYQPMRVKAPNHAKVPAETFEDFFEPYDWPDKRINPHRGWEIYPEALYDIAMMMKERFPQMPWYLAENGMGVADEKRFKDAYGLIQDDYRIEFLQEHLGYLSKAIKEGSQCFGYHTWTFIDCWSWLNGYKNRYGFYELDLDTQERRMKKSGEWYREFISQSN